MLSFLTGFSLSSVFASVCAYLHPIGWLQWFFGGTFQYCLNAALGFLFDTPQGLSILFVICLYAVVCYCSCPDDKNEAGEMPKKDKDEDDSSDDDDILSTKHLCLNEKPPPNAFQRTMRFFAALFKCPIWIVWGIMVVVLIFSMPSVLPRFGAIVPDLYTQYFTADEQRIGAEVKRNNAERDAILEETNNRRGNLLKDTADHSTWVHQATQAEEDAYNAENAVANVNSKRMKRPEPTFDEQKRTCLPRTCAIIAEKAPNAQHFKWCVSPVEKDIAISFSECTFECVKHITYNHFLQATAMLDTGNSGDETLLLTTDNFHIMRSWLRLLDRVDDTTRDDLLIYRFDTNSASLCDSLKPEIYVSGNTGTDLVKSTDNLSSS
jgi:hypothetical protein